MLKNITKRVGTLTMVGGVFSLGLVMGAETVAVPPSSDSGTQAVVATNVIANTLKTSMTAPVRIPVVHAGADTQMYTDIAPSAFQITPPAPPEPEPAPIVAVSADVVQDDAPVLPTEDVEADAPGSKKDKGKKEATAPVNTEADSVMETARSGIGVPYVWAGDDRGGWDCSGFVSWVYAQHGKSLPHSASAIINSPGVVRVSPEDARPGDLVYHPGHIGFYAGNGTLVDAGNKRVGTSERNLWGGGWSYYRVVG